MRAQGRTSGLRHDAFEVGGGRGGVDALAARLARIQQGNVTHAQLRAAGVSSTAIGARLRRQLFRRLHRGVYFVGQGEITAKARAMAAALACGKGAVVSHRSAACLCGFLPERTGASVHVTVVGRRIASADGIVVHFATALDRRDVRDLDDIPITSPARTLLDIAAADGDELEAAFDEAVFSGAVRTPQLRDAVRRSAGRPGVKALRALVEAEAAGRRNRLEAEKRFRTLVAAASLPAPEPNATIGRFVVDFLWAPQRVVVELDGFATHRKRRAFEADRARDGELLGQGYRVVRVTWRQLTREPHAVVARVAAVLAIAGPGASAD